MKGVYITIEGMDGCGKSLQASLLSGYLRKHHPDREIVFTREPGGTPLGARIRDVLKLPSDPLTMLLLFLADRNQHHIDVIQPALERDAVVISDRGAWSSIAYQGYAFQFDMADTEVLHDIVAANVLGRFWPDVVIYVDTSIEVCRDRLSDRDGLDWYESQPIDFWKRLQHGYDQLALTNGPGRWSRVLRVSGEQTPEETHQTILKYLEGIIPDLVNSLV